MYDTFPNMLEYEYTAVIISPDGQMKVLLQSSTQRYVSHCAGSEYIMCQCKSDNKPITQSAVISISSRGRISNLNGRQSSLYTHYCNAYWLQVMTFSIF